MSEPFLSEIKIVSFNFPPKGWALCNGQFLPINQNQALFALLGTTYGGNGQTTFALPNLRGRVPIHMGSGHTHAMMGSQTTGDTPSPTNTVLAENIAVIYNDPIALTTLNPVSVSSVGGSQPHNNMMPYLTLNFIIALQGIFPSQN